MDVLGIFCDSRVVTVILGVLLVYLIYRFSTRNHTYWKEKNVPFVKPVPFLGSMIKALRMNFEDMELENFREHGRIYGYYETVNPMIIVGEPEYLRDILLKEFQNFSYRRKMDIGDPLVDNMISAMRGEDWKRVRSIMTPTFSTGKIKRMLSIFKDCAKTLVQNFKTASEKNEPVEIIRFCGAFSMDVIASSAFSTKIDTHNDPENIFVQRAKKIFSTSFNLKFLLLLALPKLVKIFKINVFPKESLDFFKSVTLQIIEERKKTGQKRNDFLQLLMDSAEEVSKIEKLDDEDDIAANYGNDCTDQSIFKINSTKHLSMDELVSQCIIFFVAGYHTTATTLGLTTYLLAVNQDIQEKLYKEMKDILSETDGELTYESAQKMKYLDNVMSETLRLYPVALRLERTADIDYKVGDTGITIPKGMVVAVPIYAMHRDPELFPNPDKFDPERFNKEQREKQVPYSYLPFGAGPRNCVGMRFALMEIKICLIYIFCTFHVLEPKVPLEFHRGQGMLVPKPIKLQIEQREDSILKA